MGNISHWNHYQIQAPGLTFLPSISRNEASHQWGVAQVCTPTAIKHRGEGRLIPGQLLHETLWTLSQRKKGKKNRATLCNTWRDFICEVSFTIWRMKWMTWCPKCGHVQWKPESRAKSLFSGKKFQCAWKLSSVYIKLFMDIDLGRRQIVSLAGTLRYHKIL